jgi:hypothetical protein
MSSPLDVALCYHSEMGGPLVVLQSRKWENLHIARENGVLLLLQSQLNGRNTITHFILHTDSNITMSFETH